MSNISIIVRAIIFNEDKTKIILVRNKNQSFWYPPGGRWEHESENILECVTREVFEEVGIDVEPISFLYIREGRSKSNMSNSSLEIFWLCKFSNAKDLNKNHIDLDFEGSVVESEWFKKGDLKNLTVFPIELYERIWEDLSFICKEKDRFIGINIL